MLDAAFGVMLGIFLLAVFSTGNLPFGKKDDTDGKNRSGLAVYTDYGTGVQYVSTVLGGLTVRVDKEGKPMVVEVKENKR